MVQKRVWFFPNWGGGKMTRSSQVAPNVITIFNVNKCPSSKSMMGIYELQTKWLPQFGFGIDKDGLCKVGQGLGLERRILYEQKWNFMKNELKGDNPNLTRLLDCLCWFWSFENMSTKHKLPRCLKENL